MTQPTDKQLSRRDALKLLGAAAGASVLANLPSKWSTPQSVAGVLPAHAATSPGCVVRTVCVKKSEGLGTVEYQTAQKIGQSIVLTSDWTEFCAGAPLLPETCCIDVPPDGFVDVKWAGADFYYLKTLQMYRDEVLIDEWTDPGAGIPSGTRLDPGCENYRFEMLWESVSS